MKSIIPYIIGAISGALIIFLLFKGCKGDTKKLEDDLKNSRDSVKVFLQIADGLDTQQKELISVIQANDSAYRYKEDSFTRIINNSKQSYNDAKIRIKNLVASLITAQQAGDTTHLLENLDSLKIGLSSAEWVIGNLQSQYDQKDSLCNIALSQCKNNSDSLIANYNKLRIQYDKSLQIIAKLQIYLEQAIQQIKKGKPKWGFIGAVIGAVIGFLAHSK